MFYLGCGLGGLAKGPLGVALPMIAVMGYVIWTHSWGLPRRMRPLPGLLLTLLLIGAWMVPANWLTGGELVYELVWIRTLQPIFVPLQGHGGETLWEYLLLLPAYVPVLFLGFLPWCPFLIMGWPQLRTSESWRTKRMAFLLGWSVMQLAVFSLVRTKLPHHILPIMPPLAVLCAVVLVQLMRAVKGTEGKWHCRGRGVLTFCLTLTSVAIIAIPLGAGFPKDWIWFLPAALVMAAAAWHVNAVLKRRRYDRAFVALAVALCLCFGLVWQIGLPRFEKGKSVWRVSRFLKNRYNAEELESTRIGLKGYREVSMAFYLGRSVDKVNDLHAYLRDPSPAVVVIPEETFSQAVDTDGNIPSRALWRAPAWIAERNKWVTLLVVTNQLDRGTLPIASTGANANTTESGSLDSVYGAGLR